MLCLLGAVGTFGFVVGCPRLVGTLLPPPLVSPTSSLRFYKTPHHQDRYINASQCPENYQALVFRKPIDVFLLLRCF